MPYDLLTSAKIGAAGSDIVSGLGSLAYNIYAGERNRSDYLKQQAFSNDLAMHGMKYRMQDMIDAGLHPTLATGAPATQNTVGAAGVGNPGHEGTKAMDSVLSAALMDANINKLNADADAARAQAENARASAVKLGGDVHYMQFDREIEAFNADTQRQMADLQAKKIDIDQFNAETTRAAQDLAQKISDSQIGLNEAATMLKITEAAQKRIENKISQQEYDYILQNEIRMGTQTAEIKMYEDAVKQMTGGWLSNALFGRGITNALEMLGGALHKKITTFKPKVPPANKVGSKTTTHKYNSQGKLREKVEEYSEHKH